MTEKELKKLGRTELLEIMYELRKQLDAAKRENEELRQDIRKMQDSLVRQTNMMVARFYKDKYGELPEAEPAGADTSEGTEGQSDE